MITFFQHASKWAKVWSFSLALLLLVLGVSALDDHTCYHNDFDYGEAHCNSNICGSAQPREFVLGDSINLYCEGSNPRLYFGSNCLDCDDKGCGGDYVNTGSGGFDYYLSPFDTRIDACCWALDTDKWTGDWAWCTQAIRYENLVYVNEERFVQPVELSFWDQFIVWLKEFFTRLQPGSLAGYSSHGRVT